MPTLWKNRMIEQNFNFTDFIWNQSRELRTQKRLENDLCFLQKKGQREEIQEEEKR